MSSSEFSPERVPPQPTQDARDLLARLYREIGISAVAAALDLRDPKAEETSVTDEIPVVLRNEAA